MDKMMTFVSMQSETVFNSVLRIYGSNGYDFLTCRGQSAGNRQPLTWQDFLLHCFADISNSSNVTVKIIGRVLLDESGYRIPVCDSIANCKHAQDRRCDIFAVFHVKNRVCP